MNADDVGFTVAALTDGTYVGEFFRDDEKIDIYFYSKDSARAELDNLGQMPIYTPQGTIVPLSSVADIRETVDTNTIRRINAKRTVTLNIIPPDNVALETGVEIVRSELVEHMKRAGEMPFAVTMNISGASDQLDATRSALCRQLPWWRSSSSTSCWSPSSPIGATRFFIMTTIPLGVGGRIGRLGADELGRRNPAALRARSHHSARSI